MPNLTETVLTTYDDRLYFTLDEATTITGDVASVPVGWIELDENSEWRSRASGQTQDGQTRATRGHARPVVTNREDEITFRVKPKAGAHPSQARGIDVGVIMRLLLVHSDGSYRMDLVQVSAVEESSNVSGLPDWNGTAQGRAHPVLGTITTWPPVAP